MWNQGPCFIHPHITYGEPTVCWAVFRVVGIHQGANQTKILTLRSSFPAAVSVAEKQGPYVALHMFHHASLAMCIPSPPASGTP